MTPHYVQSGPLDAPAVVLSHSLGSTNDMWEPQLAALENHYRVIRYDTRGHGGSVTEGSGWTIDDLADDLVDLLQHLKIPRAHFVGISLGGATAMHLAAREPERVHTLTLMCTGATIADRDTWTERAALVRASGCEPIVTASMGRWFSDDFHTHHGDIVTQHAMRLATTDHSGYAGCCDALAELDLRAELPLIKARTLVIYGSEDEVTPQTSAEYLAGRLPHSQLHEITGAKHMAPTEKPDRVNELLLNHLANESETT